MTHTWWNRRGVSPTKAPRTHRIKERSVGGGRSTTGKGTGTNQWITIFLMGLKKKKKKKKRKLFGDLSWLLVIVRDRAKITMSGGKCGAWGEGSDCQDRFLESSIPLMCLFADYFRIHLFRVIADMHTTTCVRTPNVCTTHVLFTTMCWKGECATFPSFP